MFAESRSEGRLYMLFCAILQKGLETLGVSVFAGVLEPTPHPHGPQGRTNVFMQSDVKFFWPHGGIGALTLTVQGLITVCVCVCSYLNTGIRF